MTSQDFSLDVKLGEELLAHAERYKLSDEQLRLIARGLGKARNGTGYAGPVLTEILQPEQLADALRLSLELAGGRSPSPKEPDVDDAVVTKVALDAASKLMEWSKLFLFWTGGAVALSSPPWPSSDSRSSVISIPDWTMRLRPLTTRCAS